MARVLICLTLLGALSGCGLAETAATGAAVGTGEVEQAKQAKATEERARQRVNQAIQVNTQMREQAEKDAQAQ
jgi:hypothetical protein